ncbi:MAG TPA: hypothetical protein DEB40_01355 [Elusimicrobia bacterium]|nr:hypothetical protein [Elusimicrobiota bacterium]HBT60377.1 hypothetical protein [Elusimicrobiota bacterium]
MLSLLFTFICGQAAWAANSVENPSLPSRGADAPIVSTAAPRTAGDRGPSRAPARGEAWDRLLRRGHAYYFRGDFKQAIIAYEAAIRLDAASASPWINGGAVLEEAGEHRKAAFWYAQAARLDDADPEILSALGWEQLRSLDPAAAASSFRRALQQDAEHAAALLGLARAEMAVSHAQQAVALINRAASCAPLAALSYLFLGRAYEALGDRANAVNSYRQGVGADSYFLEGREALGRLYVRMRNFNEAFRQLSKIRDAEPGNPDIRALLAKVVPLLGHGGAAREATRPLLPAIVPSEPFAPGVPVLRVGIGTNNRGKPRPRRSLAFSATSDFILVNAKTGKNIVSAEADEYWTVRVKAVKKRFAMELRSEKGHARFLLREAFLIRPISQSAGLVALSLSGGPRGSAAAADTLLRGEAEIALFRRNLRLVNRIDLENYTHGVVSAEMPIRSPLEALKAQAVVARTHALFIKNVTRRHRREGYDVCDGQHCQVYEGVRAESKRSRGIVDQTRGVIVTFRGKPAHVIYSSNCGGRTQSGRDLTGWGDVPYWKGISDAPVATPPPDSPWALRLWLHGLPQAYCKPSTFVHPSHFRWARVIPWGELSRKIDRHYRTGKLKFIRPLRRSASGNVNVLLIEGSRRRVKIDSEMAIRGLLGIGSLRSTLFTGSLEYGPASKPEAMVFRGGGWGHGVGLCQSGAMGRAEAGQDFQEIILSYFPGTALGRSGYAPAQIKP